MTAEDLQPRLPPAAMVLSILAFSCIRIINMGMGTLGRCVLAFAGEGGWPEHWRRFRDSGLCRAYQFERLHKYLCISHLRVKSSCPSENSCRYIGVWKQQNIKAEHRQISLQNHKLTGRQAISSFQTDSLQTIYI